MPAIRASRASQRGHAALRALVRLCAGRLTPVVVVVALTRLAVSVRRGVKRLLNIRMLLQGLWGGLLGASELLALSLTTVKYGPRESWNVPEEVKGGWAGCNVPVVQSTPGREQ